MFGLHAAEVNGIINRRGANGRAMIMRRNGMVDPDEREIAAIEAASAPAGEYLESIGKTDLAAMSGEEWLEFIEVVVTAFCDEMAKLDSENRNA